MGFVPWGGKAEATLALIALGYHDRMIAAVKRLVEHADATPFEVILVVNAADQDSPLRDQVPEGVLLEEHRANLGWVGGLHIARSRASAPLMGWLQDDMSLEPGWVDAMVAAFAAHPEVAMCGARVCDVDGNPHGTQAGFSPPGVQVIEWTHSDIGLEEPPDEVTLCAWVPSGGSMVRLDAWDAIGGVDIRMFPLGWVDFDYCAHLRAHGYRIAHVASARVRHVRHMSTPGEMAQFVSTRNMARIKARWEKLMWELGPAEARAVPHDCVPWVGEDPAEVAAMAAEIGAALVVPFARHVDAVLGPLREENAALREEAQALRAELEATRQDFTTSTSWRVTAPLRAVRRAMRRQ